MDRTAAYRLALVVASTLVLVSLAIVPATANLPGCNNCIEQSDIDDGAVGPGEIKTDAVRSAEIRASAVGAAEIAAGAVGSSEIADGSVGASDLAPAARAGLNLPPTYPRATSVVTVGGTDSRGPALTIGADGLPVIAFGSGEALKFAKCLTTTCSSVSVMTLDTAFGGISPGAHVAIGTNGKPVVAYRDAGGGVETLKLIVCGDASCSSGNVSRALASDGNIYLPGGVGILGNGFPAVAAHDFTDEDVELFVCGDATCSTSTPELIDGNGREPALAVEIDGKASISYWFDIGSASDLYVARCADVDCSGGITNTEVDAIGSTGRGSSIAIGANGFPVVSYRNQTDEDVYVVRCLQEGCVTHDAPVVLDPFADLTSPTSIAVLGDGIPIVLHESFGDGTIRAVRCADAACSDGGPIATALDVSASGNEVVSVAMAPDGNPILATLDGASGDGTSVLKVAKCWNPFCASGWWRRG